MELPPPVPPRLIRRHRNTPRPPFPAAASAPAMAGTGSSPTSMAGDFFCQSCSSTVHSSSSTSHRPTGPASTLCSSRAEANKSLRSTAPPAIFASRRSTSTTPTMCSFRYPQESHRWTVSTQKLISSQGISGWA